MDLFSIPNKLLELKDWFVSIGFDVYLFRYSAHREGERAHDFTIQELKGDYYFCGFSLGCLIYALALKNNHIPQAHKNIFLSPAFKPTLLIELSNLMPKRFFIP
jgi:hypothetical protein